MKEFFDQGYLIVRQVASPERIQAAKKIVNFWSYRYMTRQGGNAVSKGKHFTAELLGDVSHDPDLLHLYTMSPFPHILQRIMGKDEVEIVKNCRVMQVYPCLDVSLESPALLGDRWNIEGFTKEGGHSPYNVLIGVALTDMTSTDMVS